MKQIFRCYLRTLAPVHIGSDEVYEPMGFVINENTKQMTVFEPVNFFSQLSHQDLEKFSRICLQGSIASILEIYKFLQGRPVHGRTIEVSAGLVEQYRKTLSISVGDERKIQNELNRFTIGRTSFLQSDQRPYIPGSGVKGVLRTAYLSARAKIKKVPQQKGRFAAKELEKTLLDGGSFESDPFRLVKVSDFKPVGEVRTRIVYAINQKKKPSKFEARGPFQILEVIQPGAVFVGDITVDFPQKGATIRTPIKQDDLLKAAAIFYKTEKIREDDELKSVGINPLSIPADTNILRIGRHSGAESLTINGHRNIKIMRGSGQPALYMDHATTVWLASDYAKPEHKNDLVPFGWVQLAEMNAETEQQFEQAEKDWQTKPKSQFKALTEIVSGNTESSPPAKPSIAEMSPFEKLLKELSLINAQDAGRIGTVIQKIETLKTDQEKAEIAKAIRDKIGEKAFKKHKQKDYLAGLIAKVA